MAELLPLRVPPMEPFRVGNSAAKATPSLASACSTRAAATAMSRFSFCAVSSSGASSSAPYLDHQSFWGQTGALLAIGAVKPGGTSPGRSRGVGLAVQAAMETASTLALTPRRKAPRNKDFIELSLPKWGGPAADYKFLSLKARLPAPSRKYGGRGPLGKAQAVKL